MINCLETMNENVKSRANRLEREVNKAHRLIDHLTEVTKMQRFVMDQLVKDMGQLKRDGILNR